jgi:hypothetical protein
MNIYQNDAQSWKGWVLAGDQKYGNPALAAVPNGEAYVVARDSIFNYWINHYRPGFGFEGWIGLGGDFATEPTIASALNGTIYVVGIKSTGIVGSGRYLPGSGFLGWFPGPASPLATGKPAVVIGSDGAAYVSIRSTTDNSIWMARLQGDVWGPWISGGGYAKTDPELAATGGTVYVVVTNTYDVVYVQAFREGAGNGWQGWQPTYGVLTKASIAATGGSFFIAGKNGAGTPFWYQPSVGWANVGNAGLAASELSASPK